MPMLREIRRRTPHRQKDPNAACAAANRLYEERDALAQAEDIRQQLALGHNMSVRRVPVGQDAVAVSLQRLRIRP